MWIVILYTQDPQNMLILFFTVAMCYILSFVPNIWIYKPSKTLRQPFRGRLILASLFLTLNWVNNPLCFLHSLKFSLVLKTQRWPCSMTFLLSVEKTAWVSSPSPGCPFPYDEDPAISSSFQFFRSNWKFSFSSLPESFISIELFLFLW